MYSMILVVNSFVIFHNTFSIAVDELNAYSLELIAEALMMEHTVIDAMEEFPWTVETHKFRGTTHQQRTRHIHEQRGLRGHGCHPKVAQNQRHASSHRAPISEFGEDVLPAGCALGETVVKGVPCVALPSGGKELFNVLMSFVERDDYQAVLELARRSESVDFTRKCGFTVALRPEGISIALSFPEQLCVCEANLLHYAICISSFRAAIALLIVCPAMLHARCRIVATNPSTNKQIEEFWGASELARIFCLLYDERGNADVSATAAVYNQALPLLEIGERNPAKLPYLTLPSREQRIAAAGCDADATVAAFVAASRGYIPHIQQQ